MDALLQQYKLIRSKTTALTEPLTFEDQCIQTIPEISPTKWHLAHTTWFFERIILKSILSHYKPFNELFDVLFNSYYNGLGDQYKRSNRGWLSRPTVQEVMDYRAYVDDHMLSNLSSRPEIFKSVEKALTVGFHHEQQHQELMVTDIKHVFAQNPLYPEYWKSNEISKDKDLGEMNWVNFDSGIIEVGAKSSGFSYDNENPRHLVHINNFNLASRTISNNEYLEFMEAGGYSNPLLWLSDGWHWVKANNIQSPLYWVQKKDQWHIYTLSGLRPIQDIEPVMHVSYYEAQAFATWRGCRLPTEHEWEKVAQSHNIEGEFQESGRFHPVPLLGHQQNMMHLFGNIWEWTQSPYIPYPGFRPLENALEEYNGKFMCNQMVLKGGSCLTPRSHMRASYRNFYYPHDRWQFMGFRLAKDGRA
jgi:ergothioneine biosynthesis protein EgtB